GAIVIRRHRLRPSRGIVAVKRVEQVEGAAGADAARLEFGAWMKRVFLFLRQGRIVLSVERNCRREGDEHRNGVPRALRCQDARMTTWPRTERCLEHG